MLTDPISDMLNRIKSAQIVAKTAADVPYSKLKHEIAKCLERAGFVAKLEIKGRQKNRKVLHVLLKYIDNKPAIIGTKRVSKPGQRIYHKRKNIKMVRQGYGVAVLSTSQGVLSDREARKKNLGGEVLCNVW